MSKQSERLRDQARRAERLALTISDDNACAKLKDMSRQFDKDAERLEKTEPSRTGPYARRPSYVNAGPFFRYVPCTLGSLVNSTM